MSETLFGLRLDKTKLKLSSDKCFYSFVQPDRTLSARLISTRRMAAAMAAKGCVSKRHRIPIDEALCHSYTNAKIL